MTTASKTRRSRRPKIVLSSTRLTELEALCDGMMRRSSDLADLLVEELGRARIVSPSRLRADVVDIGRHVTYRDEATGSEHLITLVFPQEADISAGRISVMTPIGVAMIGLAEDAAFHWETRTGHRRGLKILKVAPADRDRLQSA